MKRSIDAELRCILNMDESTPFSRKKTSELLLGVFLYLQKRISSGEGTNDFKNFNKSMMFR